LSLAFTVASLYQYLKFNMYFSTAVLSTLLAFAATTYSWEVVDYTSGHCNDDIGSGTYRILEGSDRGQCHQFTNGNGVTCSEYHNGGADGPFGCGDNNLIAASVGDSGCTMYTGVSCNGAAYDNQNGDRCFSSGSSHITFGSFKCVSLSLWLKT
jgi:hypothetical protein